MKISVDFEIIPITTRVGSHISSELIKEKLVEYIEDLLKGDAPPFSQNAELWIDVSERGESKYNVYQISLIDELL